VTTHPLRLGYKASAEQFGPRQLLDLTTEAEECGFDSVWISDHFQPWRHTNGHAPFALSWLGAAAERTKRVILGTSVLTPTFRYQPAVIAQAFGTLGTLYPNRIILGVGSGESLNEVAVTASAWPPAKERLARLREAVDLIRRLWSEELVTFDGQYYRTLKATIYDKPDQPVPLYISAGGPVARNTLAASRTGSSVLLARAMSCTATNCYRPWKKAQRRRDATPPRLSAPSRSKFRSIQIKSGHWRIRASGRHWPYRRMRK